MDIWTCVLVAVGGALGTLSRFWLALVALPVSQDFPWGTMLINVVGSFLIGLFGTLTLSHGRFPMPENARLFVMVGFCGGFTTFSSFSLQTLELFRSGAFIRGLVYAGCSVFICLCAVGLGHALAASLNGGMRRIAQSQLEEEA